MTRGFFGDMIVTRKGVKSLTLADRIKKVRKDVDLTQQEFGKRINMKQNSIALIEGGRNTSPQTISAICREFNISEEWLRDGVGPMRPQTEEDSINELIKQHGLDSLDRQIILEFIRLSAEDRQAVKKFVRNLAQYFPKDETPAQPLDIDQEVERYRQQLLSEQEPGSQALSAKESGVG